MILSEIQMGRKHQMRSMDQSLLELYGKAEITYDVCLSNARDKATCAMPPAVERRLRPAASLVALET